jgi:chlorophyll(ide) b reductase
VRAVRAGASGGFGPFLDASAEDIKAVTQTNLLGTLLCTRAAMSAMSTQSRRGHIFNVDGAGADGDATPGYAAYGATKAAIAHLMPSVAAEAAAAAAQGSDVAAAPPAGVHTLSPGMVLTELLLAGATVRNKQVFNVLCEHPEISAAFLVPRVRSVAARNETMAYIRFLTGAHCHAFASPAMRGVRRLKGAPVTAMLSDCAAVEHVAQGLVLALCASDATSARGCVQA